MSGFELRQRTSVPGVIDAGLLSPAALAGKGVAEIERLSLPYDNRSVALGEVFLVRLREDETVVIVHETLKLVHLGHGLSAGRIEIEGMGSDHLGQGMRGGEIHLRGSAGFGAGAGMSGGTIIIDGDAGEALGGGIAGESVGMSGGLILLRGHTGARAGERLRRGTILIEGDCGDYAAARMVAGTVIVLGRAGHELGFLMRRGSVILAEEPALLPWGFADHGRHRFGFLALLGHWLAPLSPGFAAALPRLALLRRFTGDPLARGKGELLLAD